MLGKLFKIRTLSKSNLSKLESKVNGETILRKDALVKAMEEAISEDEVISFVISKFSSSSVILDGFLDIISGDTELARRYRQRFLRELVSDSDMYLLNKWIFLRFLLKANVDDEDIEILSETENEESWRDTAASKYKILPLLLSMRFDALKQFFEICSANELLRKFLNDNTEIITGIATSYSVEYFKVLDCIVEYVPECISRVAIDILSMADYRGYRCKIQLYVLQIVADSKYFLSELEHKKLRKFVTSNAISILDKIFKVNILGLHKVVWLFENEFDVDTNEIFDFLEGLYKTLSKKLVNQGGIVNSGRFVYCGDYYKVPFIGDYNGNLGFLDCFLLTKEGYYIIEDNCYSIVSFRPSYVVELSNIFPNLDENFLFKIAKNPNNELFRAFM